MADLDSKEEGFT